MQGIVKWYLLMQPHHHVVYLAFGICSLFLDLSHQEQIDNKDVDVRMLGEHPKGFAFLSGSVPMCTTTWPQAHVLQAAYLGRGS